MKRGLVPTMLALAVVWLPTLAAAQGSVTSSLTGTVFDAQGGAIPGATITATHNSTGTVSTTVSAERGTFSIPALAVGTYTVTVELSGFKTAVLNDVVLNAGVPPAVGATQQGGGGQGTKDVEGATALVYE